MLSLAVTVALAAGPTFSGAATVGASVSTASETVGVLPVVALRLGVTQAAPVGIVRGRLATQLPFPSGSVVSGRWMPWAPVAPNAWFGVDLGSFLEFERPFVDGGGWRLRLEPFNPSMRLVTFDWANAVGRVFSEQTGLSPVVSADLQRGAFEGFLSLRPTWRQNTMSGARAAYVDVTAGLKLSSSAWVIEGRAGRFAYGPNPGLLAAGIVAEQWTVFGATRLSWNHRGGVDGPLDLVTYAQDPRRFERFFSRSQLQSDVAAALSLEAGAGAQPLQSPSSFMTTVLVPLAYADLQARVSFGPTRLFATARLATLSFIQADAPGLPLGFAPSRDGVLAPALWGFLGADTSVAGAKLTPGVLLRVAQPATLTRELLDTGGNAPPPGFVPGTFITVLDGLNDASVVGSVPLPRFAAKASLRWTPLEELALVGEVELVVTPPRTPAPGSLFIARPVSPLTTRTQLFVQARF
ncbi:MAG: hypothetical protein IAE78_05965 [Myxococcus sp.]|nr:hypothetical protein [Myxococcus sp.]